MQLEQLTTFNSTLTTDLMKPHERIFSEKIKNIRRSSEEVASVAVRLDLAIKNAWGSLEKTTSEQGLRLTQTIRETSGKLSGYELEPKYEATETFHKTAIEISNKIIISIRKYVPKLHKVLKTEIAALNSSLTRLEGSINSLGAALDNSPGRKLETLRTETEMLLEKDSAARELETRNTEIEQSILKSKKAEDTLLEETKLLLSRDEFRQLHASEDALKIKTDEINQYLQHLAKPLRKFERTLPHDSPIDRTLLEKLIEDPKEAVSKYEPPTIIQILNSLEESLTQGKLGIEERKRKKAHEVIESARNGELNQHRMAFQALQEKLQSTNTKLIASGLADKNEKLKQQLLQAHAECEQLKVTQDSNRKRTEELTKTIAKQKQLIESEISKLSGHKISISRFI